MFKMSKQEILKDLEKTAERMVRGWDSQWTLKEIYQLILKMNEIKREDVKQSCVITNGKPHIDTIKGYEEAGYIHLKTDKANKYHPYAVDTDYISFFAKPIDKEKYDNYMDEFRKIREIPQGC